MISFRSRNDTLGSSLIIGGVLLVIGSAIWMNLPLPKVGNLTAVNKQTEKGISDQIGQYEAKNERSRAEIEPLVWDSSVEQVGPQALSMITKLAKARSLKIVAFRPQKPVDLAGLTEVPFSLSVDGTYLNTMQLVKDLETSNTKLAVSLAQVQASDAASDHVTGTINVIAFLKTAPETTTKGGTSAQKS